MIKNIVTISLTIFVVVVIFILGAGVFINQNNQNVATTTQNTVNNTISITDVAKHNSANDCWLVINNKTYNVTNYINSHPAGPETIIPYCGKDATTAFDTKGGRGSHSQNAQNILTNYFIGNITR